MEVWLSTYAKKRLKFSSTRIEYFQNVLVSVPTFSEYENLCKNIRNIFQARILNQQSWGTNSLNVLEYMYLKIRAQVHVLENVYTYILDFL